MCLNVLFDVGVVEIMMDSPINREVNWQTVPLGESILYARLHTQNTHTNHIQCTDMFITMTSRCPHTHACTHLLVVMDRRGMYFAATSNIQDCCNFSHNLLCHPAEPEKKRERHREAGRAVSPFPVENSWRDAHFSKLWKCFCRPLGFWPFGDTIRGAWLRKWLCRCIVTFTSLAPCNIKSLK